MTHYPAHPGESRGPSPDLQASPAGPELGPAARAVDCEGCAPASAGVSGDQRTRVLAAARAWLGTPYQHQASLRGVGCDCLGLVRGVWREVVGPEPETPPAYRPDWAESGGEETLLAAARRWLVELDRAEARPGDVLLFRMAPGVPVKHCALLSAVPTEADKHSRMIHAYWGRAVVESWIVPWWAGRVAAAFAFPMQTRVS